MKEMGVDRSRRTPNIPHDSVRIVVVLVVFVVKKCLKHRIDRDCGVTHGAIALQEHMADVICSSTNTKMMMISFTCCIIGSMEIQIIMIIIIVALPSSRSRR